MRFAHYILALTWPFCFGFQTAYGQDGTSNVSGNALPQSSPQTSSAYQDLTLPPTAPLARLQKGRQERRLKTLDTLDIQLFARRMGQIKSITRGNQGELYVADEKHGRIFTIPDHNQDGRAEQILPLPYQFNGPSAVAFINEILYVADREAVWKLIKNQTPIKLASLQNIQSQGRYFLTAHQAASTQAPELTLGYSTPDNKARLISIDIETGRAQLLAETDGNLLRLAAAPHARPWVVFSKAGNVHIGINFDNAVNFGPDFQLGGIALPHINKTTDNWPDTLKDHIFISRQNAYDVVAVPTALGTVLPRGRDIFSGFQNGRTAWGTTGELYLDGRGLFIADPYNGDLWLIQSKPKANKSSKKDTVKIALDKLNAVKEQTEAPLARNPLEGIYDSHFPDPNAPPQDKDAQAQPTPIEKNTPR